MNIRKDIRFRVYITYTCICLFGCAIIIKAAMIQTKEGPKLRAQAKEMHTRFDTLKADRGNIYTENGELLSASIPEFEVHIDFSVIDSAVFAKNIDSLSRCLERLLGDKPAWQYKRDFIDAYDAGSMYYPLCHKLKYYQYEEMRKFPIFNLKKGYGGFMADAKEKRNEPYNLLARRTIGMFRDSNITGLEARYNDELLGEDGSRVVQKTTGNTWVPVDGSEVDPLDGKDIVTTLDINVQAAAEDALMSILKKYDCKYGTCIVMEVSTGKIRTMVNLGRQDDSSYEEDFNYALIPTEPGSTFKLVTLLSLLNDRYINVDNIVDAEGGRIQFGKRWMRDSHLGLHQMPIWKAYAESSNAAMAKLAFMYYKDNPGKYVDHLLKLHLDKPTGIDLPGERPTVVLTPQSRSWSNTSLPWMATGYGVMVSPLHTCMLYNALANNGKMMKPYLVSGIKEYGKVVQQIDPVEIEQIGDSNTIAQLHKCVRAVVTEGTAKGIESPFYTISGKTGTAKVADKGIKYTDLVYQGSFVGFIPADHPKYTICVVIRTNPHSKAYYGGAIAAPVFRMVADKIFSESIGSWAGPLDSLAKISGGTIPAKAATAGSFHMLLKSMQKPIPVPGDYANAMMQLSTDSNKHVSVTPQKIYFDSVPDVTGMGLKDAVYMLESSGLQVQVVGKGKVNLQSVPPGTKITKGLNITLQLS